MKRYLILFPLTLLFLCLVSYNYVSAQEIYVIKSGDSLWQIAHNHKTSVDELKRLNNLNSELLQAGDKIIIQPSKNTSLGYEIYTVKSGDTLWYIARHTNMSVERIKQINGINSDNLFIGQELKIIRGSVNNPSRSGTNADESRIMQSATQHLGTPYRFGGAAPGGFDCSGFVSYVFNSHGYSMPRTAAAQYNIGTAVDKVNLKAGDLVFFNTYGGVSHVGIYAEKNKFIHASSPRSGGVIYSSLDESYYSSRYIGAKRILR